MLETKMRNNQIYTGFFRSFCPDLGLLTNSKFGISQEREY
jgi:hypothetical protein